MDVVGTKTLMDPLKLWREGFQTPRGCVIANQMALHAIIIIRNYSHCSIKVPRVLLLSNINRRFIKTRVVNIRIFGSVNRREIINQGSCLT